MKLAVLFSGGKDSTLALERAMKKEEVVCLISLLSKNPESYMFHTPNIGLTKLQAEAIGLPLIQKITDGKKEREVEDLRHAIEEAKRKFGIEGVVTGGVESVYQAERFQRVCDSLDLWCFNPLWLGDQKELLREAAEKFEVIISGVFAFPLGSEWLGRKIDRRTAEELVKLNEKYQISPAGEGGEFETLVLDAPFFKKRIEILEAEKRFEKNSGVFLVKKAKLVEK